MPGHNGKDKEKDGQHKGHNNDQNKGKEKDNGKGKGKDNGLMNHLMEGDWVLVFTDNDQSPVFGQVKDVDRNAVVLENLFIPFVEKVVIPLDKIVKVFVFGDQLTEDQLEKLLKKKKDKNKNKDKKKNKKED
ncbi:hypothetical protein [Domibacillus robiginosus]|uniref:hypothetical protein n=1 Tax=Domibacillus robiginosus TaxID=1071054 RepID=UPI00067AB780|nr:hypothetical protein [Domibacillus robiginosus]